MLRISRRLIAILALIGLLIAPAFPILAVDSQPVGLFERVRDWIAWSLKSDTNARSTFELDSEEPSPVPDTTPEPVEESAGEETEGEMYPEWDPNG